MGKELKETPPMGIFLIDANDISKQSWDINLSDVPDERIRNQKIRVSVEVPSDYPFKPPHITLQNNLFHPNVIKNNMCLKTIISWTPKHKIIDVLTEIKNTIALPDLENPLCSEAFCLYKSNREKYYIAMFEILMK